MKERLFDQNNYIMLEPIKHVYINNTGRQFQSITTRLSEFKEPFDAKAISKATARGTLGKSASDKHIELYAEQLQ